LFAKRLSGKEHLLPDDRLANKFAPTGADLCSGIFLSGMQHAYDLDSISDAIDDQIIGMYDNLTRQRYSTLPVEIRVLRKSGSGVLDVVLQSICRSRISFINVFKNFKQVGQRSSSPLNDHCVAVYVWWRVATSFQSWLDHV